MNTTMKLIAVPATEDTSQTINILTHNGNKYASVIKCGIVTVFGEDMSLDKTDMKQISLITDNFDLFYYNIKTQL